MSSRFEDESITTGIPNASPFVSLEWETTESYESGFMKPSRGENPPLDRSSTSQSCLSVKSTVPWSLIIDFKLVLLFQENCDRPGQYIFGLGRSSHFLADFATMRNDLAISTPICFECCPSGKTANGLALPDQMTSHVFLFSVRWHTRGQNPF